MVKPSIAELSKGNTYNRYMLVMMAAKGAKYVTDRENFQKEHGDSPEMLYNTNDIEIDFLISNNSKLKYKMFPIEVKSGKRYTTPEWK